MRRPKEQILTIRTDETLLEALKNLPNRSEFIRQAILHALDNACPLCQGTGILTPNQKKHWEEIARDHQMAECDDCHEPRLICEHTPGPHRQHKGHSSSE